MFHSSLLSSLALLSHHLVTASENPPPGTPILAHGLYNTPETLQPKPLEIIGYIPSWITGSLYRGAQAGWDAGNYSADHWFDGFSRTHRFEIENGSVIYRSRNASDELQDFVRETGFFPGGGFANDPCKIAYGDFETVFRNSSGNVGNVGTDSVQVSYIRNFPGLDPNSTNFGPLVTLVATTDGENLLQQIDPVTLEPIELFNYGTTNPNLDSGLSSAHPAIGENGEVYNYILDLAAQPPVYKVFGIENGDGRVLANITDAPPAYIHSLFSTEHYVILVVWQCDLGEPVVANSTNFIDRFQPWDPSRDALFYVISKTEGGVVAKYTAPAFYAFHEINSFEDHEDIVIDLPWMEDYTWIEGLRMPYFRDNVGHANQTKPIMDVQATFTRFRLPGFRHGKSDNGTLKTREASIDFALPLKENNIELPKINEAYLQKPYRYAYGIHVEKPGFFADSIIKIDVHTQTSKLWVPETNHLPSEPIFVARPGVEKEDDGVLLIVAMDEERELSSLVVIDACTMKEIGRARMPVVMGYGFHGLFAEQRGY
jgi:torulene dioxygenase